MIQQTLPIKTRKNMRRLLAELASRQQNWRQEKTQEIINSQKSGLGSSSFLKVSLPKNPKELSIIKSANQSAKYIQFSLQNKPRVFLGNTSNLPHNGKSLSSKRSNTQKSQERQGYFMGGKTMREDSQSSRYDKQVFLPKIALTKAKSIERGLDKQKRLDTDGLQTIEEQQPSRIKKGIIKNSHKTLQKEFC